MLLSVKVNEQCLKLIPHYFQAETFCDNNAETSYKIIELALI